MDPPFQVHLAKALDTEPLRGIDQVPDLHGVSREERDRLEQRPAAGILPRQRLDHPRQLRVEQVDERSSDELRDPPAAAFLEHAVLHDRALVVALDVLQARLVEERPERPVDHPRVPVLHVRVGPHDDVAGGLVDRFPERLALADERAVSRQNVGMLDDARALGLGDLACPVGRCGVDDEHLIEQRHPADHLTHGPSNDGPDRLLLVERRQDETDRDLLLLLEDDEPAQVGELGVMEVRLTEPALDANRYRAGFLGGPVGSGQRLGPLGELVERPAFDHLPGLDDHDGGPRARRDRLRQGAEQVRLAVGTAGLRGCAHDHQIRFLRLAQDGVADVRSLAQEGLAPAGDVLLDERRERTFRLDPDGQRDAGRHEVEDRDRRIVVAGDGVGEAHGQLRVRAAADRDEDAPDLPGAALLDDRDVAWGVAHDLVDRRREDRGAGRVAAAGGPSAPAEDDEVGFLLRGRLDDALGGVPSDTHDRVDRGPVRGVVKDALQESPGVPGASRALGQRHPLRDLHDPECR